MNEKWKPVLDAIARRKAEEIRLYDLRSLTPFVDTMAVVSTRNVRMNAGIVQAVKDALKEMGWPADLRVEGRNDSRWILLDLQDLVIHIFVAEEREFYGLDRMYADVFEGTYDV